MENPASAIVARKGRNRTGRRITQQDGGGHHQKNPPERAAGASKGLSVCAAGQTLVRVPRPMSIDFAARRARITPALGLTDEILIVGAGQPLTKPELSE